ncbi:metallophosphoesterase [Cyclobacterium marinum]|uniref:Metallophosphoesterase n=1 Tax=Cyclobacterium marinum (strain ATCC 25205 / DSM 745 / LMG 13164 / NCIMB 1802) TaxID=880070 RepID=G0IXT4_CYCMS|nr:metallophosphoesterase [Cyclobacterium marinum]AEL28081.1 metallophosphoesterase [Cyclobacterium marinum DSM 745]
MKFERKPMVNWYDPKQLAFTSVKTVLSSVFGNFADRRELQAALDQDCKPFDYSKKEALWFDYISDLGDGFNSTYTIASLLAREQLELRGKALKRGDVLIMGGDEVYPTPENIEYDNRLRGPYTAAFPKDEKAIERPDVFAIPGNHDWYDGLTNFLRLFTQKRSLGNWKTQQNRSYFALKLPYDYWVIAIDIQLNADIDFPQICFFKKIAKEHFNPNSKVILCTSEPSWVYKSFDTKNNSFDRLQFFIDRVLLGQGEKDYEEKNKSVNIEAILTGDLHHYARYETVKDEAKPCHFITAGGGGAFMHPTHTLSEEIIGTHERKAELKKTFPSKSSSAKLSLLNLAFPFFSLTMLFFFGTYNVFTTWILQTKSTEGKSLMEKLSEFNLFDGELSQILGVISSNLLHFPSALFLNLLLFVGLILFTDTSSGKKKLNYIAGVVHGLLHVINFYFLLWLFSYLNLNVWGFDVNQGKQIALFTAEMVMMGGFISCLIFGLYLTISVSLLKNHITEASSSYRWEGYKNFLRISVTKEGLTIYPIGVKKVVSNWKAVGTEKNPRFEGGPINYELIEDPIFIKNEKTS